ncbi:hypothetical protein Tsubulata_028128, partial [Turnera subulata]
MTESPKTTLKPAEYNLAEKNKRTIQFIEDVQKKVLEEILSHNAHVEYLQRHGLGGYTGRDIFKKVMPVITYEDIQPDITRITNGDTSPILCSKPISEFLTSSGTSGGERKLMPTIEEELRRISLLYSLLMPVMSQFVFGLEKGKGIQNKEVLRVGVVFAFGFIRAIRFLEKHWRLLCNDIRTGTIDPQFTDPSFREAVMKILKPYPKLPDFIEEECSKESWQGITTRLWPNSKFVDVIVVGTMSQYIPMLDYYSNGLPLVCTMCASSECYFGVNLNPLCKPNEVSYTLIPTMAYFEFLPVHRNNGVTNSISMPKSLNEKEQQELVDLVDEYELVMTTYAGLYRYKVGDVLRVAGFKNKAPQFNFICRKKVVLSIDSDKTDEVEQQNIVKNAVSHLVPLDANLAEYISYADTTTIPGHYVLFWELTLNGSTPIPPSVFEDCCLIIEESLNSVYRQGRVSDKSIGPLEIKI